MRVLITGITGFIGAELARRLVKEGHEVFGMIRHVVGRTDESLDEVRGHVKFVTCDITDYFSVRGTIKKVEPEVVFHLAALSPVRLSFDHPIDYQKSIHFGTIHIAEAIRDLYGPERVRMIIASTAEVYGMQGATPFVEEQRLQPSSPYAVAKASMDMYIRMLIEVYNFNAVLLRNSNTFGRNYDDSFFTEYLITEMLNGRDIYIGAPDSIRDYMYVDDHVNSYILAMKKPEARGDIFNIAGGRGYTNKEWTLKIAEAIGFPREKIHFGEYPPGYPTRPIKSDQPYLVLDSSKAQRILGWRQTVTPEEGLKKTVLYWAKRLKEKDQKKDKESALDKIERFIRELKERE